MPKTILYITTSPGAVFGGGKRVFQSLIVNLDRTKFRPVVACSHDGLYAERLSRAGVELRPINFANRYNFLNILRLANIIRKEGVDIIHSQGGGRANFYAVLSGSLAGIHRIVATVPVLVEGYDVGTGRKKIYTGIDRFIERRVSRFITVSDRLKSRLVVEHGLPHHKIIRIYNGIDTARYVPGKRCPPDPGIRKEYGISAGTLVIGSLGRMVPGKGFEYLLRAIPMVASILPDVKFIFVGEGPLKKTLVNACERLNVVNQAIFTGFRRDIRSILADLDVLAVPSLAEGFPMVVLEAMAMAKPIIATDIDGINEQIEAGVSGVLIPPGNPGALAKAIVNLALDKPTRAGLGAAARKRVATRFSAAAMVAATANVYQALLSEDLTAQSSPT